MAKKAKKKAKTARKKVKKAAKRPAKKKAAKRPAKKKAKKAAKRPAKKKAAKKKKRAPNPAFMRPFQPDEALAAVVGRKPISRPQITKKIWAYIKKNGLQDTVNRRNINADEKLRKVFNGKSQVTMFEMTKLINKHFS